MNLRARNSMPSLSFTAGAAALTVLPLLTGCVTTVPVRATAYDLNVRLDPAAHAIDGRATLTLRCTPSDPERKSVAVRFALNRALKLSGVTSPDATVLRRSSRRAPTRRDDDEGHARSRWNVHTIVVEPAADRFSLVFDYQGTLFQDVSAGEQAGQIHNFLMNAHISPDGIYLAPGGAWYPMPYTDENDEQEGELAAYRLAAMPVEGMVLVAGAAYDEPQSRRSGQRVWLSEHPLDGMVLVGGPHTVKSRRVGDIDVALHYARPDDAEAARTKDRKTEVFLDATEEYLGRYEPLIGPYPFRQFTIVENFFSSGFAFPEFTLLSPALLTMGEKALKHGYLDHELLHAWWGNGIYVNPKDGNWCEALASYGGNYYGFILDGDEEGARKVRRDSCNGLSRIAPEHDKPLGTFGHPGGAGRGIGYGKGAMVFHMIARRIGQDPFWSAMRRLTREYVGTYAGWRTLQTLFEQESGQDLDRFFKDWVRTGGAPNFTLERAAWLSGESTLEVTLNQGDTEFELSVPLRVMYADGSHTDERATFATREATVRWTLDRTPVRVVLDPDYHVFRKLAATEVMPTTTLTRSGKTLLVVKPDGPLPEFYQRVIDRFRGEGDSRTVTVRDAADVTPEELAAQSVLVLGDAVRRPDVAALLARTPCPVTFSDGGFTIEGVDYHEPNQSVLCTVHHPDQPTRGITVYVGNGEDALGRSDLLLFYGNSLLVFETTVTPTPTGKQYDQNVALRRDFEPRLAIDVTR